MGKTLEEIRKVNPRMAAAIDKAVAKGQPTTVAAVKKPDGSIGAVTAVTLEVEKPPKDSPIMLRLLQQLTANGFLPYEREYYAIPGRDFRLDVAFPQLKVGVEVQGQQHRIKGRYKADVEKRALHQLAGWTVLELDRESIKTERSVEWLHALLRKRGRKFRA